MNPLTRHARRRAACTLPAALLLFLAAGCGPDRARFETDQEQLDAYLQLVMPTQVRILEWTKPVSLVGDGDPDAVECILEVRDAFDDLTKVVGRFNFELQTRPVSGPIGERVAFWPVEVDTPRAMRMYRDHLSRFYHFPLQLEDGPLKPGRYSLSVWLLLPTGKRLFDEYEFDYDGSGVPPATAF
jgi:hypothetical protein